MKTIEQRIADMEAQLALLKEKAKAGGDVWPKIGCSFYYIGELGVYHDVWNDLASDKYKLETGSAFRCREEANLGLERRKVLTELRKLAKASWGGGNADWSRAGQYKWELFYDHKEKEWSALDLGLSQTQGAVYFATGHDAEAAIETIGADRLMLLLED